MTTKRKIWIGVALIIAILIFTNPSENKFKQFIDFEKPGDFKKTARTNYFLLFSIFEWKDCSNSFINDSKEKYLGVFNNFYKINERKIIITTVADSIRISDSMRMEVEKAISK